MSKPQTPSLFDDEVGGLFSVVPVETPPAPAAAAPKVEDLPAKPGKYGDGFTPTSMPGFDASKVDHGRSLAASQALAREGEIRVERLIFWRMFKNSDPELADRLAPDAPPSPDDVDRVVNYVLRGIGSTKPDVTIERIKAALKTLVAYDWALKVDPEGFVPPEWSGDVPFDLMAVRERAFPPKEGVA